MANKDAAFGLRPAHMMGGAPYSGGQSRYRIANNQSGAIFQGDLVKQLTGGTVSRAAASSTVPVVGVFNGCRYTDPTTSEQVFSNYYPGSIAADDIIAPESVEQMLGLLGCLGPNSSLVVISDRYHPAMAAGRMETTVKLLGNDDIDAYSSFDAVKMHGAYEMLSNYSSSDILGLNNAAWSALAEERARPKYSYMKAR